MLKLLPILIISLVALSLFGAEVTLPASVTKAEETMNIAVSKAREAYMKALDSEVKKFQGVLEKEKSNATKAGSLELALALKAKQDATSVESVEKSIGTGDVLGNSSRALFKSDKDVTAFINKNQKWVRVENGKRMNAIIDFKQGKFLYVDADEKPSQWNNVSLKGLVISAWDETTDFSTFDGTGCVMKRGGIEIGRLELR